MKNLSVNRGPSHVESRVRGPSLSLVIVSMLLLAGPVQAQEAPTIDWEHLSSTEGDLPVPGGSDQQTATAVPDVDGDDTRLHGGRAH